MNTSKKSSCNGNIPRCVFLIMFNDIISQGGWDSKTFHEGRKLHVNFIPVNIVKYSKEYFWHAEFIFTHF